MSHEKTHELEAQLAAMRQVLIQDLNKKHHEVVNYIRSIPIPQNAFHQGLLFLDTGMLWIKEAITFSPISIPVPPASPPQDEGKAELEDLAN
jgi:hypothetical protein